MFSTSLANLDTILQCTFSAGSKNINIATIIETFLHFPTNTCKTCQKFKCRFLGQQYVETQFTPIFIHLIVFLVDDLYRADKTETEND